MKPPRVVSSLPVRARKPLTVLLALSSSVPFTLAQSTSAPPPEETVTLPTFTITEDAVNPYQSQQALSTSRVAVPIQDIPQTISVVTSELMKDTQGMRMLDVAKYVTPVVESSLPFGGDRYQIRGFQVSQEFIDGTVISGADGYSMSLAPYNIERIEVIKGPNSILVPGGSPGGVMNPITKSPFFRDQATFTLELAEYFGNSLNTDINRVLNQKGTVAARVVAAYWRNDGYIHNQFRNGYMVAPSVKFALSPTQTLTIKGEVLQNRETNLGGLPIDPGVRHGGEATIARGLPRNWSFGNEMDTRHRATERLSAELISNLGEHVTSRLYLMADHVMRSDVGATSAGLSGAGGGSRNPFTGRWEPGVSWNTGAYNSDTTGTVVLTGTSVPVTDPSTWIYTRNAGRVQLDYLEGHLKNDYAARFDWRWLKSTTIAGLSANTSKVHFRSNPPASNRPSVPANNLGSITYPGYLFPSIQPGLTTANLGTDKTAKQNDLQLFIYETLSALDDRLQVSGGISRYWGELTRTDTTGTAIDPTLLLTTPSYNLSDTATSFGVVVKPIKQVSLFYGYNESGGTMPGSLSAGANAKTLRVAEGSQDEFGVKTSFFNGKLTTSLSYFQISQANYPQPNSEYYNLVNQGRFAEAAALPNPLYLDLTSRGWEFEASYSVNKNLTVLGNYTRFKIRQPITYVRVRAVPDNAGAVYADYRFTEGTLDGFGMNIGIDYKDDVAGENVTGYTTTRLLPNGQLVANQPSFVVAARTLVNVGFSYRRPAWTARLTVTNAMDKDYILAAGSRSSLIVGEPRAVKGSISYSF